MILMSMPVLAQAAPGKSKSVECRSPNMGYQVSIRGQLKLKPVQSGAFAASGKLAVQMGSVRGRPNPVQNVLFRGQYDKVKGFEYATLGAENSGEIDMLYINFGDTKDRTDSYIEMRSGARQPLDCSQSN
ncbi:MAG: hypothetical protein A2Z97_16415 [Bdellovibrionales bacterium GWB1_52_6]|nr:MAG: hypothetical protein A2Z97_16415 [Bdellovibrionales bacterium GWB1_52_6]